MLPAPRILSEQLAPLPEPLACLLRPGKEAAPAAVAARSAWALLDVAPLAEPWPKWLAPHQAPAAERLSAIIRRYGGALLADAVGLGKSYVALAVALALDEPFVVVVPAVLADQWRALLERYGVTAPILTHESLSLGGYRPLPPLTAPYRLIIVDEAHRFRNPDTRRYRALATLVVGVRVLLVTATPVHNRIADLFHLFRLFLRDHDLTALGVPSLARAARGELAPEAIAAVAARLIVARSRGRVRAGYTGGPVALAFPERAPGAVLRASPVDETRLGALIAAIGALQSTGEASALLRLLFLSQLASSLAAFRSSVDRYAAFLDVAQSAAGAGRALGHADFQRLFPPDETGDLQLTLLPLVLPPSGAPACERDRDAVRRLRDLAGPAADPKVEALARLLTERPRKTIVFVRSRATLRYLMGRLRGLRVAAVMGETGLFGRERAAPGDVLRAFAPRAQGAAQPAPALETDVLIATDLVSEGLNLQDATRVIHYDLPWSPARLAQRVGRIDRMASAHGRIETATFVPPHALEAALALEQRLAIKTDAQDAAGAAHIERVSGADESPGALDWCDRLQLLARSTPADEGGVAAVAGDEDTVVLIVRIGTLVEALVVTDTGARADPEAATQLLEYATAAPARPADLPRLERAIHTAASLVRVRVADVAAARWRAADRNRLSRRLVPWVLTAARRAARRGESRALSRLDTLVSRLALGMTAGEEIALADLLEQRKSLAVGDVLRWHERLPPTGEPEDAPAVSLVGAVMIRKRELLEA